MAVEAERFDPADYVTTGEALAMGWHHQLGKTPRRHILPSARRNVMSLCLLRNLS